MQNLYFLKMTTNYYINKNININRILLLLYYIIIVIIIIIIVSIIITKMLVWTILINTAGFSVQLFLLNREGCLKSSWESEGGDLPFTYG